MPDVKRTVKLVTEQRINASKPAPQEGFPMRDWSIEVHIMDTTQTPNQAVPANCFEKAVYKLHPTFGNRATQTKSHAPFRIEEEGWGEFDMTIVLTTAGKGETITIPHDLNFQEERYESTHVVSFKNPKPELLNILRQTGPVPGDSNGATPAAKDAAKKRSRGNKNVDMEKLAEGLQKLAEEDLLHVVQLVHDNKTAETYTKNDVENGEFHVDLYTLPDSLVKMLWDLAESKNVL